MNKGLEALAKFCDSVNACVNSGGIANVDLIAKEQVEQELKAFEIIKDKIKIDFNDHYFGIKGNYYIIVNHDVFGAIRVDKEEFYLLKEVLL